MNQKKPVFPLLETRRLRLREHCLADEAALYAIFSDEAITRYYNVQLLTDPGQARPLVERRIERFYAGRGIRWAITFKDDDTLIGSCGFHDWHMSAKPVEIGYELAQPYWNQGLMTEALRTMLAYGFQIRKLRRVRAWVMPENRASARVLEKLGFRSAGIYEGKGYWNGRFHDLELFSLNGPRPSAT